MVANHQTTLEISKTRELSRRGDCIIGINADKGCEDLSQPLKAAIRSGKPIKLKIMVEDTLYTFTAYGNDKLQLSDPDELVIRKSEYISPRTMAIKSTAAAIDVPRKMVSLLQTGAQGTLIIEV